MEAATALIPRDDRSQRLEGKSPLGTEATKASRKFLEGCFPSLGLLQIKLKPHEMPSESCRWGNEKAGTTALVAAGSRVTAHPGLEA